MRTEIGTVFCCSSQKMLPNAVAVSKREHWRGDLVHIGTGDFTFLKIENYTFVY
jgi:hypothetical protein